MTECSSDTKKFSYDLTFTDVSASKVLRDLKGTKTALQFGELDYVRLGFLINVQYFQLPTSASSSGIIFNKYIILYLAFINNATSYQVELPIINYVIVITI